MQKIGRLGVLFFLIIMFLFQLPSTGQNKKYFVITGRIVPEFETPESGTIDVSKGNVVTKVDIPKNGRFRLELEYFNEYTLTFKLAGHFSKTIIVSTDIPQEVWKRDNDFPPFPMIVQLFREIEGIDKSFTLKASGRVFYGKQTDNFEKETIFNDIQIAEQIETAKIQSGQVKKEAETITKQEALDLAARQKNYDQSISEADILFKRGEYQLALIKYQEAKKLFPEKAYANDRIAELQDLVKALEITEKQKAELELKYKNAIARANGFFDLKTYKEARPVYEEAMQYKPGDVFASGRIQEIDKLLALLEKQKQFDDLIARADNNFKSKTFDQAILLYNQAKQLIPENEYPQNQINLINQGKQELAKIELLEKEFNQTIQNGDNLARQKDYLQAINMYRKALEMKPDSKLASDKIAESELAIVAIETDKKYQETIQQADQALAGNDLQNAKMYYQAALKLKSAEVYPKNKLAEITRSENDFEMAIQNGDQQKTQEKYDKAINFYRDALKIKPNNELALGKISEVEQILEKEQQAKLLDDNYNSVIARADKAFGSESYDDARKIYTEALTIKPNEAYPTGQISKIDGVLAEKARLQQIENEFQAMVGKGDAAFDQKNYDAAKTSYNSALGMKPNSVEVKNKIKNIDSILQKLADDKKKEEDRLLALAAAKEKSYTDAIAQADKSFDKKDWAGAQTDYRKALTFKPDETHPANRIKEIDQILEKEQQAKLLDDNYKAVIVRADKAFGTESYDDARKIYTEALTIKPNEAYPTGQISKIDGLLAEKARLLQIENEFLAMVGKGDAAFDQKNYDAAKTSYTSALGMKPNSVEVKNKIKNIDSILQKLADDKKKEEDRLLALAAAKEKSYTDAIATGNKQIAQKTYSDARITFQEAKKLKPAELLPDEMIAKIDSLIAGNERELAAARLKEEAYQKSVKEAMERSFNEAMASGDKAFSENDFNTAKTGYQTALSIKANDPTAKEKLGQTEAKLAQLAKMTQAYNTAITAANQFVGDKRYKEAKEKYQEALQYLPDSDYPKSQIKKLNELLAQADAERQKEELYASAIKEGETLFTNKEYSGARLSFVKASELKPAEPLPVRRIKEIDKVLADRTLAEAKNKATESGYQETINRADKALAGKEYSSARLIYGEAISIKPTEQYPKDKIAEIDQILADLKIQQYNQAITAGDLAFKADQLDEATKQYELALASKAKDPYATKQLGEITKKRAALLAESAALKKLNEQYEAMMADAKNDFNGKEYQKAKGKYQNAILLKPAETVPKEQIAKIDALLKELMNAEETNRLYVESVKTAQEAFRQNKLKEALDAYTKAHDLKPSEPMPPMRINELTTMIAQLEETAKLAAMEDAQRLAKEKADKDQYDKVIVIADKAFAEKQYKISRTRYTDALSILPNEKYPKAQIDKIDDLIAQQEEIKMLAQSQAMKDSIMKVRDEAFNRAMASAKELEHSKQYQSAILKYKEAISINPGERSNVQKLIVALEDQIRLMEIQDKQYQQVIAKADQLFAAIKLEDALAEYRNAANIKTTEEYPKKQIIEIQNIIAERNGKYDNAIKNADNAFNESDWQNAKAGYTEALLVKPDETYPRKRLKETDQKILDEKLAGIESSNAMIGQRNKEKLAQSQLDIDEKYRQSISVADNAFREKTYPIARLRYQESQLIKPDESYPKNQMALIDKLMNEAKPVETYTAQELPVMKTVKPASAPVFNPAESAQATEARAQSFKPVADYDEAISKADDSFGVKDYTVARFFYYKASELKPEVEYPKNQIELIRKLVDSELSILDRSGYEQAITQADEAFSKEKYTIARFYYYKALEIKSWEKYPKDRIQEIMALTNSLLSEKEEKEYRDLIAKGDEAYFDKEISIARFYFNKAITIKTDENYPRIKLKDIQKLIDQDIQDQNNLEYNKLIDQADQALQAENFSIARFNYNKALNMKPDEKYPKDQLKRIKETLDKQNKQF